MNKSGNKSCKCEDKTNQKNIQLKEERKNILRKKNGQIWEPVGQYQWFNIHVSGVPEKEEKEIDIPQYVKKYEFKIPTIWWKGYIYRFKKLSGS